MAGEDWSLPPWTKAALYSGTQIYHPAYHARFLKMVEAFGRSGIPQMKELDLCYVHLVSPSRGEEGRGPPVGDPRRALYEERLRAWAAGFALAGLAAEAGAIVSFRRAQTTMNPLTPGKATRLVVTGIYRWTRNPMYVGLLLWLVAWALFLGHALAWGGMPLFILTMNRLQIAPEERAMTALFGAEYAAYCARVRRWV